MWPVRFADVDVHEQLAHSSLGDDQSFGRVGGRGGSHQGIGVTNRDINIVTGSPFEVQLCVWSLPHSTYSKLLPLIHVSIFSLYSSLAACDHFRFFSPSSLSLEAKAVSMVRAACTVLLIYGLQFGYILFLWGHHPLDASR